MPIRPIDPSRRSSSNAALAGVPSAASGLRDIQARPRRRAGPPAGELSSPAVDPTLPPAPTAVLPASVPSQREPEPQSSRAGAKTSQNARTGPNWDEDGNYKVGKNRPPENTRWKPGQSGNPDGRKAKVKPDAAQALDDEILAPFVVTMNGKDVTLNLGTLAIQSWKKAAAAGTVKAAQAIFQIYADAARRRVEKDPTPDMLDWEQDVLDEFLAELGLPAQPVVRRKDRSDDGSDGAGDQAQPA
jgi:hypothetical protein